MTTTAEAPAVATQPPVEPVLPALLQDQGGFFRLVKGRRIPVNEPGIAVLDGTPAASAYETAATLDASIKALQIQYDIQIGIVKDAMGHKKVATLLGQKVVTWGWSLRKSLDRAMAEAVLTPDQYAIVEQESPTRSFEPRFRG